MPTLAIKTVLGASYDRLTNTVSAQLIQADGNPIDLQIDGLAFATLMGLANIENAVAHHQQVGTQLPWLQATGLQTGSVSNGKGQYSFGLTLMVRQIGQLNFLLPPQLELALREKLQTPKPS